MGHKDSNCGSCPSLGEGAWVSEELAKPVLKEDKQKIQHSPTRCRRKLELVGTLPRGRFRTFNEPFFPFIFTNAVKEGPHQQTDAVKQLQKLEGRAAQVVHTHLASAF
jgi:hypothetical protein